MRRAEGESFPEFEVLRVDRLYGDADMEDGRGTGPGIRSTEDQSIHEKERLLHDSIEVCTRQPREKEIKSRTRRLETGDWRLDSSYSRCNAFWSR